MTVENQDELKKRAAVMYYRDDMTQAEIARALYLSRTKISRLLKAAATEIVLLIRKTATASNTPIYASMAASGGMIIWSIFLKNDMDLRRR